MSAPTMDLASRVIKAATGEEYGDGYTVMNIGVGIRERGYGDENTRWATGDWNNKRWARDGEPPLTREERMPSRLARALEWMGVECMWHDEWIECQECYMLFRCQPDSYGWIMAGEVGENGATCAECMLADVDSYLEEYESNADDDRADRAVTWCGPAELKAAGWVKFAPGDEQDYESGWHPGQDDEPPAILENVRAQFGANVHVVFLIDGVGQFDVRFSAWIKPADDEDESADD